MINDGPVIAPESLKFLRDIERHGEMAVKSSRIALYNIGKENTRYARQLIIRGPKTGRLYRIKGRKRRHRASAPGEAPANLTGRLQKSVNFIVNGHDEMKFGDQAEYGLFLELGTRKMKPRPHLSTTVNATKPFAEKELGLRPIQEFMK